MGVNEDDFQTDIGRAYPKGSFVRITHLPTGERRQAGPLVNESIGQACVRLKQEVIAALRERGVLPRDDGVSDVIITGLKPDAAWINLAIFLHDECGMSFHDIKAARADLRSGKEIRLSGLTKERAIFVRQRADA